MTDAGWHTLRPIWPLAVTRELEMELSEMWQRILRSPLFILDFDADIYWPIWSGRYWWLVGWMALGRVYRLLIHRFHVYWVDEGQTYDSGFWVKPSVWRFMDNTRKRDTERRRLAEQHRARLSREIRDMAERYPEQFDLLAKAYRA